MKLYNFDLLAYPDIPPNAPGTPIPSSFFEPSIGVRNYREHLEEMAYCEELGFEGVVFNEHHYSAYGTMPSPNLITAALSQRTRRMKIGILGQYFGHFLSERVNKEGHSWFTVGGQRYLQPGNGL
jgi:hypothetical protein